MPRTAGSKRRRNGEAWTVLDHAIRAAKLNKSKADGELSYNERRRAALSRDSREQQETQKLRLHIVKTERDIEKLRERLRSWDDVEVEEERKRNEEAKEQDEPPPAKKSKTKGPETWKLRGAARPAHEIYDFDTRYVDPHAKAHEEACKKAKRSRNILALYKGRMGEESDNGPPQPSSRNFLALLMQLGHLRLQAKKFKAARTAFIECMDLDGTEQPITSARCQLMRLYLEANRPESARRLWEKLPNDTSVWIRYSAALVEYVSWNVLKEDGSTRESAEALLAKAIQANVFCAYYLAFSDTFDAVMEYTEDIEDADETTLEESIEYCCSEQRAAWVETDGSIEWLRQVILRALHGGRVAGGGLTKSDLEWEERLEQLVDEREYEKNNQGSVDDDSEEDGHDIRMFSGMFRTGMEMLQEAGELAIAIPDPDEENKLSIEKEGETQDTDKADQSDSDGNSSDS